MLGEMVTS
jgi:hypothetical protein